LVTKKFEPKRKIIFEINQYLGREMTDLLNQLGFTENRIAERYLRKRPNDKSGLEIKKKSSLNFF
jgi:hypothetical protein